MCVLGVMFFFFFLRAILPVKFYSKWNNITKCLDGKYIRSVVSFLN